MACHQIGVEGLWYRDRGHGPNGMTTWSHTNRDFSGGSKVYWFCWSGIIECWNGVLLFALCFLFSAFCVLLLRFAFLLLVLTARETDLIQRYRGVGGVVYSCCVAF